MPLPELGADRHQLVGAIELEAALRSGEPVRLVLAAREPKDPATALASGGLVWLLVGLAYPGNTGFAIRLAEVSWARAVFVDSAFLHEGRREALRAPSASSPHSGSRRSG